MGMVLNKRAYKRLRAIHQRSKLYNGPSKARHIRKLLSLAKEHIDEIIFLKKKGDAHYLMEVGDLLILCLEILIEDRRDVDRMVLKCFDRYERKLNQLMSGAI